MFLRNLNVKKNPELNFKALVEMNHNYKHSEFDADINYGPDFKDQNRSIEVSAQLNHDIKGWASASADGSLNFKHVGQVCLLRKTIALSYFITTLLCLSIHITKSLVSRTYLMQHE